ncbi:E3 ubiquitin-protein ligase RHF2A isoform X2 [Brachypodium distachyon]|uniref:E3 ubiquitin-protein ligase RHF2A isoform X2 n=1 Tax=Brachypodium distachyon TaxID=15368 RepID=UPI00052FF10A|nr:E3 ubiquitin-protein ligase RHF2A isoform X2 [Brachypodium distachyon]|eukprot:XP_010237621.1 E3 ubiquitin-protein ligase RHF2A isoform X2 [Brachypodium distachyon]
MASGTDEKAKMESLTSPAAFVEGGVQDACDDACSICLEAFCESDPSALTGCKHEFHLQCILEWCQRSSQCPMCWQPITMKDPTSQELLEAVERERNMRTNQTRNTTIFHHPALGDFELPVVGNDAELEERILQHLAAAAAMGRSHHLGRREGQRGRSVSNNRPQFLVFSAHPNTTSAGSISSSSAQGEGASDLRILVPTAGDLSPRANSIEEAGNQSPGMLTYDAEQDAVVSSGNSTPVSSPRFFNRRHSTGQSTPDRAGPSDLQSFSDSLKSRLNAVSTKYKESITKSTRGWKERLFSRNSSVSDLGSEVRREVNNGIASVSRMMERLETRGSSRGSDSPTSSTSEVCPTAESSNERVTESNSTNTTSSSNTSAPCVTTSGSN